MKIQYYQDENRAQVVLTPEGTYEENLLMLIKRKKAKIVEGSGEFYNCQGGYTYFQALRSPNPKTPIYIVLDDEPEQEPSDPRSGSVFLTSEEF